MKITILKPSLCSSESFVLTESSQNFQSVGPVPNFLFDFGSMRVPSMSKPATLTVPFLEELLAPNCIIKSELPTRVYFFIKIVSSSIGIFVLSLLPE